MYAQRHVDIYVNIDFTSFVKNSHVERLAEADEYEVVKEISVRIPK